MARVVVIPSRTCLRVSDSCLKESSRPLSRLSNLGYEKVLGDVELAVSGQSEGSRRLCVKPEPSQSRVYVK